MPATGVSAQRGAGPTFTGYAAHDPLRPRKLLLTKRELHKLKEAFPAAGSNLAHLESSPAYRVALASGNAD